MVDIIDCSIGVNQLDEILDDLDYIFFGQDTNILVGIKTQFLVDAVTAHLAQVITLVREEQVLDNLLCTCLISRISITQLLVDVEHGVLLRVCRVFLQCVEHDGVLVCRLGILVEKDSRSTAVDDVLHVLLCDDSLTLHDDLVALD